jgi:cation diffusion facilitator CzcD-associated flavoprotein CzcO
MPTNGRVLVIGAGPAGLAVAAVLQRRGARVVLLERSSAVGAAWRARYDGLRLNTVRWFSHLPGLRIPAGSGRWLERDRFVQYLEEYAAHHRLSVEPGVEVQRIDRASAGAGRWRLSTSGGPMEADHVVVATGAFHVPVVPDWPGRGLFAGELCHAAAFRTASAYAGRSVLVAGAGASGLEIALLLSQAGAQPVYLSARRCQNLFPRELRGVPLTPPSIAQHLPTRVLDAGGALLQRLLGRGWPRPLPRPAAGIGTALRRDGEEPVVADGIVGALRGGRVQLVSAVAAFTQREVLLADGGVLRPSAVIAATGYTHGLRELAAHLGVLAANGLPLAPGGGRLAAAPGLAFVGFEPSITGRLPRMGAQARNAAATLGAG